MMNKVLAFVTACLAAVSAIADPASPSAVPEGAKVLARGPHHTDWELVTSVTNEITGEVSTRTSHFTQLETGLNHRVNNTWVEASDIIELEGDGAVARQVQHHVRFASDIASEGAVTITTPDGKILKTRVVGLGYYDNASGNSALIAEIRSAQGEILPSGNEVIYRDCFDGNRVNASVRYRNSRAGIEQDIIVNNALPAPSAFGLNDGSTVLEVITECSNPPDSVRRQVVDGRGNLDDEDIDFGVMRIGKGKAFAVGQQAAKTHVRKRWGAFEGRHLLLEQVDWHSVASEIQALPPAADGELAPALNQAKPGRTVPSMRRAAKPAGKMRLASSGAVDSGFVLDYVLLSSVSTPFTFAAGATYLVSGPVTFSADVTLEGAIVKYSKIPEGSPQPAITFSGPIACRTAPYCPAIFTAVDDHSAGEYLSIVTAKAVGFYAGTALEFAAGAGTVSLENIRICNAARAISFAANTSGHVIKHLQVVNCGTGVDANSSATYSLRNALFCKLNDAFLNTPANCRGEQLTLDVITNLNSGVYLTLVNSLLVTGFNNGNYQGTGNQVVAASGVFQSSKNGSHYLAVGSPYRDVGSTQNVDPDLVDDLRTMTTYPPATMASSISTPISLSRTAMRDTDTLDLGYHYFPIDYIASVVTLTSTITVSDGAVIAAAGWASFNPGTSAAIYSSATPLNPNRFIRYGYVQEQPTNAPSVLISGGGATYRFRFTEFTGLTVLQPSGSNSTVAELSFRDCNLRSCLIDLYPMTWQVSGCAFFTNNIFDNCTIYKSTNSWTSFTPAGINMFNNLFHGGVVNFFPSFCTYIKNNLFDRCFVGIGTWNSYDTNICFATNGFTVGTVASVSYPCLGTGFAPIENVTPDFQTGPLGPFYYPASGTGLYRLVDAGNGNADQLGFYQYTTSINQTKEGTSRVDIGAHYVACNNGVPCDSDNDGIPDYIENPNGAPSAPVVRVATGITGTGLTANWDTSAGATGYYLDVATDSAFSSFVTGYNNRDVGNVTSSLVSGLTPNTVYYYRVRTSNGAVGDNSATILTTTAPDAPIANDAIGVSSSGFTANWGSSVGATVYLLDVATDAGFSSFVQGYNNRDVGSATSCVLTGLSGATTYYYRVRASNGAVSGNSGPITVTTAPAGAPGAKIATGISSFGFIANWDASDGATGYYLEVATDNAFTSLLAGYPRNVGGVTSISVTGLAAYKTYYYRVRAGNGASGEYSSTITVKTAPAPPVVPKQPNWVTSTWIQAIWNASVGGQTYALDVSTAQDFSSFVYFDVPVSAPFLYYYVNNLSPNTKYYYRVRAVSYQNLTSDNSATVEATTAPEAPVPLAATQITSSGFTANWTAPTSGGASYYLLDVAVDAGFITIVLRNQSVFGTSYAVKNLSHNWTYYYRVRAMGGSPVSPSPYSASQPAMTAP